MTITSLTPHSGAPTTLIERSPFTAGELKRVHEVRLFPCNESLPPSNTAIDLSPPKAMGVVLFPT